MAGQETEDNGNEDAHQLYIGEKLEYKPHQFNEFANNNVTYDEGKYSTIQKCVDELEPYSTLRLPEGEYTLDSSALQIKKPIYIKGIGNKVIVKSNSTACILDLFTTESVFENIRFISSQSDDVPSIRIMMNGKTKFTNCKFVGGQKQIIASDGKGYIEFTDCKIKNGNNAGMNISCLHELQN